MKKFYIYLALLAAAILLNNAINQVICRYGHKKLYDNLYPCDRTAKLAVKPKIIFVGSSTTLHGFDLLKLQKSLNLENGQIILLATSPNNPEISCHLLERYAGSCAQDAIVLYGLDPWIISTNYYQNFSELMSDWKIHERAGYIRNSYLSFQECMHAVNGGCVLTNLINLLVKQHKIMHKYSTVTTDLPNTNINTEKTVEDIFSMPDYKWSERFLSNLQQIDELLHERQIKLVVYTPTYSRNYINQYNLLKLHSQFSSQITKAVSHGTAKLDLHYIPDSLYIDIVHLKQKGMEINTNRMVNLVKMFN